MSGSAIRVDPFTPSDSWKSEPRRLAIVLIAAFLIRFLVPVAAILTHHDSSVFLSSDTETYLVPSQELLHSGHFSSDGVADIHRTPGYPILLLLGLILGHVIATTIFLQVILSTMTVYLVYRLALRLFGRAAAFWSACLYALEPLSILYATNLVTETAFTFLVILFFEQVISCIQNPTMARAVRASLAIVAATYVRPIGSYLPFIAAAIVIIAALLAHRVKQAIPYIVVFLMIYVVLFGAWCLRNYREAGYPGFSSISSENLYFYDSAAIIAKKTGRSYDAVQSELGLSSYQQYLSSHPEQAQWTNAQQAAFMGREGRRIILQNKWTWAVIHLRGIGMLIAEPGGIEWGKAFKKYPATGGLLMHRIVDQGVVPGLNEVRKMYPFTFYMMLLLGVLLVTYLILACIGFALEFKKSKTAIALMTAFVAYFVLLGGGPWASGRFRHPLMPIICLLGGCALSAYSAKSWKWPGQLNPTPHYEH